MELNTLISSQTLTSFYLAPVLEKLKPTDEKQEMTFFLEKGFVGER